jgi:hypothetical protein
MSPTTIKFLFVFFTARNRIIPEIRNSCTSPRFGDPLRQKLTSRPGLCPGKQKQETHLSGPQCRGALGARSLSDALFEIGTGTNHFPLVTRRLNTDYSSCHYRTRSPAEQILYSFLRATLK